MAGQNGGAESGRGRRRVRVGFAALNLALLGLFLLLIWRGSLMSKQREPTWFGASFPNLNNRFYHELAMELDASIQPRGHRLMVRDCGRDPALQAAHIRGMVRDGARAVFVCPVDDGALDGALEECRKAGVAVVMVGDGRPRPGCRAVTSDNESAGEQLAHFLAGDCANAQILVISEANSEACAARERGFKAALDGLPGFEIVKTVCAEDHVQAAMAAVDGALDEGLSFDTVFAVNDGLGIGAYAALMRRGRAGGVRILSVDGGPEGKHMVKNGLFAATAQQYPFLIAQQAVECALNGSAGPEWLKQPVKLITRNTIASYDLEKWD